MRESIAVSRKHGLSLSYFACLNMRKFNHGARRLHFVDRAHPLHTASQMYFLNLHPPRKYYDTTTNPSVHEIDVLVHLEHMEDGIEGLREMYPELLRNTPKHPKRLNQHEGRGEERREEVIPCSLAWEIYDYYIQDFVCLGYELPAECLKEECRPH